MNNEQIIRATAKWLGDHRSTSWEDGVRHALELKADAELVTSTIKQQKRINQ